jgi:hypothetical protein
VDRRTRRKILNEIVILASRKGSLVLRNLVQLRVNFNHRWLFREKGCTPAEVGSALSFALKLRNRNSGASHTHIPKKEAISVNPGAVEPPPR